MKRIVFYLFVIITLSSCKSITYNDLNPNIDPNNNLLPRLDPIIDIYNLEATYSIGTGVSAAQNFGTINNNHYSGTTFSTISYHRDNRVQDTIRIFEKEIKENISTVYGKKVGYIRLSLGYHNTENTFMSYYIPSMLSLYTLNLLGFPIMSAEENLEATIEILNNKKEIIKAYKEDASYKEYSAMYWGYTPKDMKRKIASNNIKSIMEKIRLKIRDDSSEIIKKLSRTAN